MTYADLAAGFVVGAAAIAIVATIRRRLSTRWWLTTGLTISVLVLLTILFDSLMIIADLFRFDEESLVGVRLWRAPIEDLAWPVAAGLLLPALRELLAPDRDPAEPGR